MLSVGELKDICTKIEKEYGSDAGVCIQLYSKDNHCDFIDGDYVLSWNHNPDGTLFLTNKVDNIY